MMSLTKAPHVSSGAKAERFRDISARSPMFPRTARTSEESETLRLGGSYHHPR